MTDEIKEAFHIQGTHWVAVPDSGTCPSTHPDKTKSPGGADRCYTKSAAVALKAFIKNRESDNPENVDISEQEMPSIQVQTLIVDKSIFDTLAKARKWVEDHNFRSDKVDETENTFRFRQFNPDNCQMGTIRTFRITDGVQATGCRLKTEFKESDKDQSEREKLIRMKERMDLPMNSLGLTVGETLQRVVALGRKFTQEEAGFKEKSESPEQVCGACRFYLRDPESEIGRCQVVDGEIPWFATSNFYISALDEAIAVFNI